ncbi:response regulator transcription factor [Janthinobacterium sp. LB2P10]|uniref:response regulator transcription factor n=1 Tax=Janthinobacterium sp. LB2P10 TaxID=3424194 RepID=UPI003F260192
MNILLVDDHPLFREGLSLVLHSLMDDVSTSEAGSCEQALEHLDSHRVDLVLLDLGLPGMSGFEGLAAVRRDHPDVPVVVLSSNEDRASVMQAIDGGAMGFIPKSSTSGVLAGALRLILAKGVYLPATVFLSDRNIPSPGPSAPATPRARTCADLGMTQRQSDVLHLVLQGKSTKIICRELDLSLSTIKAHTSAALRALNVTTRTQAVIAANKLGLAFPG